MSRAPQLPADFHLFISTPGAVHSYHGAASELLFECATDGIVNACAAKDNSSLLAVADSRLVILHDATRGADRKYRLKSGEVSGDSASISDHSDLDNLTDKRRASHVSCSSPRTRAPSTSPPRLAHASRHTTSRPVSFGPRPKLTLLRRTFSPSRKTETYFSPRPRPHLRYSSKT